MNFEENSMTTEELSFTIDAAEYGERVFADKFDDDALWLSVRTRSGGMHVTMTKQQTQDLIKALQTIVEEL
jgi:hypothetical protein